jgi:hypothetical protein
VGDEPVAGYVCEAGAAGGCGWNEIEDCRLMQEEAMLVALPPLPISQIV